MSDSAVLDRVRKEESQRTPEESPQKWYLRSRRSLKSEDATSHPLLPFGSFINVVSNPKSFSRYVNILSKSFCGEVV